MILSEKDLENLPGNALHLDYVGLNPALEALVRAIAVDLPEVVQNVHVGLTVRGRVGDARVCQRHVDLPQTHLRAVLRT